MHKIEVIRKRGTWKNLEAVEYATLEWIHWSNSVRLFEPIGKIPPAELGKRIIKIYTVQASITLSEYAKDMFIEGAPHLARWAAKVRILKRQTICQHRRHLVKYILPRFGRMKFQDIKPTAIEDFLLEQKLSNSCCNTILYTLKLNMREARRAGIIDIIPEFEPFKRNGRRQDTLSSEELAALFPDDYDELIRVWRRPPHMRKGNDEIPAYVRDALLPDGFCGFTFR